MRLRAGVLIAVLMASGPAARADVTLPAVFGSNMVLQQGQTLPVWGKAKPGEQVTIAFAGQRKACTADDNGRWKTALSSLTASAAGQTLTVTGTNTIRLENVLVGEVWICSGQSNMALPLLGSRNGRTEVKTAANPNIRLFSVSNLSSPVPWEDVHGDWKAASPDTAGNFSAVGYYFGKELKQELNVPVGLIACAWGGKAIEPFIPHDTLATTEWGKGLATQIDRSAKSYNLEAERTKRGALWAQWEQENAAYLKSKQEGTAAGPAPKRPGVPDRASPGGIYNGMVAPLVPFGMRGVIWYQGEANRADGMNYLPKMQALIGGWRQAWGQGDFPFLFVQIAPYKWFGGRAEAPWPPTEPPTAEAKPWHKFPELWQAQVESLKIPNTGLTVTMDVADRANIHPARKSEIGHRLALWALANTYGKKALAYSGPLYNSMAVEGDHVRVKFEHTGSGLAVRDGQDLNWFEVAGADHIYYPARAVIEGQDVLVTSPQVRQPVAVRFAWDEVADPNLMNREGLPAAPFTSEPATTKP